MANGQLNKRTLLKLLEENGGKLGNLNARRLLSEKAGQEISQEYYEQLKERLLSEGLIKRAPGRGGAIEMMPMESENNEPDADKEQKKETVAERINNLFASLNYTPGMRVKKNRFTLTILCGDDNDKLYCGWDEQKSAYYVQYKVEPGREDCSELAERLFKEASDGVPSASIQRLSTNTTLQTDSNQARFKKVVSKLRDLLEDETLVNAPQGAERPRKPRNEYYYLEIATLIKFCVKNDLRWPLKNWRKSLGFDDIDDLIVIGSSPKGAIDKYREHVVPVVLIRDEAIKLAELDAPEKVIADFIQHHLYVVLIGRDEQELLDRKTDEGGLSLKTSMPDGWFFGCDPLDRLREADIHVQFNRPIPIPNWKPWKGPRMRDRLRDILNKPVIKV